MALLKHKEIKRAMEHDQVAEFFMGTAKWVKENLENVIIGAVVVIGVGFVVPFYLSNRATRTNKALLLLSEAERVYQMPAPEEGGNSSMFKSSQDKYQQAESRFQEIVTGYGGSPAGIQASLGVANCDYRLTKYDQALGEYQQFVSEHPKDVLAPLALAGEGYCLEAKGSFKQAAKTFATVVQQYPDAANLGQSLLDQARCAEEAGDSAQAAQALKQAVAASVPDDVARQAKSELAARQAGQKAD